MSTGGTEKQLAELIGRLDRRRFEPLLCTLKPSQMPLGPLGCRTIELSLGSFAAVSTWGRIGKLRRFIIENRIDILQTFFQDATLAGCWASVASEATATGAIVPA